MNVSQFNLPVVLVHAIRLLSKSVQPLVLDVPLIACRFLAFQEKPVGRSVPPIPSSGLLDLKTCYLDTKQHMERLRCAQIPLKSWPHQALLWLTYQCGVLVHLPEQPRTCWTSITVPAFLILQRLISPSFLVTLVMSGWRSHCAGGSHGPCILISGLVFLVSFTGNLPWHLKTHTPGQQLTWIWI